MDQARPLLLSALLAFTGDDGSIAAALGAQGCRVTALAPGCAPAALTLKAYPIVLLAAEDLALARAIRALPGAAGAPAILALEHAWLSPAQREAASEAGIDAILRLPLEPARLGAVLKLLARRPLIDPPELDQVQDEDQNDEAADEQDARRDGSKHANPSRPRLSRRARAL